MTITAIGVEVTYGLRRGTILAALANAMLLLVAVGAIVVEAIRRLLHPEEVAGMTVIVVAAIGILVNGVTAWLFASGRKGDINLRGAFLHMAADLCHELQKRFGIAHSTIQIEVDERVACALEPDHLV